MQQKGAASIGVRLRAVGETERNKTQQGPCCQEGHAGREHQSSGVPGLWRLLGVEVACANLGEKGDMQASSWELGTLCLCQGIIYL